MNEDKQLSLWQDYSMPAHASKHDDSPKRQAVVFLKLI